MNGKVIPILPVGRNCGECAKCCEGWLEGTIHGKQMYPGNPCFYLEKTCSIYGTRPDDPCKDYTCAWLAEEIFPTWMKPSLINVIITKKEHPADANFTYYDIVEAGGKMSAAVLNWIVHWSLREKKNIIYAIDGKKHILGSSEFTNKISSLGVTVR